MKYATIIMLLLPALLWAQELQFRQEYDSIPVEINGWQTFSPWAGGESESYPEFCDIDADADLDLFIGNYVGFITYYQNVGTALQHDFHLISRAWNGVDLNNLIYFGKSAPRFCDLDGDGDLDFFLGDGVGLIHYWENVGNSSSPNFVFVTDSLENIDNTGKSHFAFADIDDDGDFDLFMGNYYGNILFYRNDGNPNVWDLSLLSSQFAGIDVGNNAIPSFADIDADGDFDLFIGNMDGNIWYYRNDGDSVNYNFAYMTNFYDSIEVDWYAAPEFADIDGDGDYDFFVGRENENNIVSPGDLFFYENVGSPSLPQWSLITLNYLSLDLGERAQNRHADIDGDGDQDLFMANRGDYISHYENVGNQDSASFRWITDTYQNIHVSGANIVLKDMDADQDFDLFVGEALVPNPPYPGLHLYQNRGTPQNASLSLYSSNLVPQNYFVAIIPDLADIDGDADYDLFITDHQDTRYYFENLGSSSSFAYGSPTFGWFGAFPPDTVSDYGLFGYCFYDIDNDGDLDMFGVPTGFDIFNWVWFYRNVGSSQNPQFELVTQELLPLERQEKFSGIDFFDIDGDGDGDILLSVGYDGGMYFFRNITGEASAPPPVERHPRAGLQISLGPNPANPITVISCKMQVASQISLEVFDISGRKLVELASGFHLPGEYRYVWDAGDRAAGMYFVRLKTPQQSLSEKLTIIK